MGKKNIFNLIKEIQKEKPENFGTGLIGESFIVQSYKTMEIEKLEKLRYIINKIIKKKKIANKVITSKEKR